MTKKLLLQNQIRRKIQIKIKIILNKIKKNSLLNQYITDTKYKNLKKKKTL
jgi:hypothetical protein